MSFFQGNQTRYFKVNVTSSMVAYWNNKHVADSQTSAFSKNTSLMTVTSAKIIEGANTLELTTKTGQIVELTGCKPDPDNTKGMDNMEAIEKALNANNQDTQQPAATPAPAVEPPTAEESFDAQEWLEASKQQLKSELGEKTFQEFTQLLMKSRNKDKNRDQDFKDRNDRDIKYGNVAGDHVKKAVDKSHFTSTTVSPVGLFLCHNYLLHDN